ncbi:uncharacterized protein TrAtP1_003565 [Trichoderma atroviride]|uniref:uncharacterized protein n=1 Tax=Hypocrea atroviridis TaxID=63577 RepID=UPI00331A346D|nr:hypothetical protein TrAtP1_003565 [Trichoderma atroviride]
MDTEARNKTVLSLGKVATNVPTDTLMTAQIAQYSLELLGITPYCTLRLRRLHTSTYMLCKTTRYPAMSVVTVDSTIQTPSLTAHSLVALSATQPDLDEKGWKTRRVD